MQVLLWDTRGPFPPPAALVVMFVVASRWSLEHVSTQSTVGIVDHIDISSVSTIYRRDRGLRDTGV
jgi:hypothetical protein